MKKKNIILMCIITFLQGMVFYASISTLYRTTNGITLLQMGIIESICSVLIMVFEIPWGVICDRIGYKKTLIVCNLIYFVSKIVFYHAHSFEMFLIERILMAFVVAGLSGCDSAFIYESVNEEESTKVFGFYHSCGTLGMVLASMMFSMFIKDNIALSGLWSVYTYGLAFVFTLFLSDINNEKKENTNLSLKDIPTYLSNFKQIIFFLIAASLFTETTHTLNTFYNQLQYERANIPMEYYGYLYMIITICSLSSASIGKIVKRIKEEKIISFLIFIGLVTCVILRFTTLATLSILCIALLTIIEALFFPIMDTILNRHVTMNRATTLSIYSMMMNMSGVVTNIIFGNCADVDVTLAITLGCIFILIAFILYQIWVKKDNFCNE